MLGKAVLLGGAAPKFMFLARMVLQGFAAYTFFCLLSFCNFIFLYTLCMTFMK